MIETTGWDRRMPRTHGRWLALLAAGALVGPAPVWADRYAQSAEAVDAARAGETAPARAPAESPHEASERVVPGEPLDAAGTAAEAGSQTRPVVYVPPNRGQARNFAAGGTREMRNIGHSLSLAVLAPKDHVALTTRAQPTLYWFVSEDTSERVDVTLVGEDDSIDPLLELTVPGPVRAGIHALSLAEQGVSLEPGKTYQFHVAIVHDPRRRSADTLAEGLIARSEPSAALERALAEARSPFEPYAVSGIWYDAMHELMSALRADPGSEALRRQRSVLLEQVELGSVASFVPAAER